MIYELWIIGPNVENVDDGGSSLLSNEKVSLLTSNQALWPHTGGGEYKRNHVGIILPSLQTYIQQI